MKKSICVLIFLSLLLFCGCAGRDVLEENDAAVPVTVEDTERTMLPERSFSVPDPENARGLSVKKIEHSYGVAKNGKVHEISSEAQKFFEEKGFNAVCYDNSENTRALYLTFDCGWENGYTAKVLDVLKEKKVPAAFFCTLEHIKEAPELIERMISEGHIVGNHSSKHPDFAKISRSRMSNEILECDNLLREKYGYSSPFFRFPEGSYSESALELVGSMGYTSVFWSCAYSDWEVDNPKGREYAFETVTSRLHPGAIVLLHSVSPDNAAALADIIDWARQNGYEFKPLTDLPTVN